MKKAILASAGVLIISSSAALAQAVYVDESYAAAPAYVAPAPVYVAPAPVYVAPAYAAPATTVIVRRTIVRPAPVVTTVAPVYDQVPGPVVLHSRD